MLVILVLALFCFLREPPHYNIELGAAVDHVVVVMLLPLQVIVADLVALLSLAHARSPRTTALYVYAMTLMLHIRDMLALSKQIFGHRTCCFICVQNLSISSLSRPDYRVCVPLLRLKRHQSWLIEHHFCLLFSNL